MVVELSNMSQTDLQATRDQFATEQREIKRDRTIKYERLVSRMQLQATDAAGRTDLEGQLAHAQQVHALLVAASAQQVVLDEQQDVIDALQRQIDGYEASSAFITDPDAQQIQFELDVLDFSITRLDELIAQVDALL